MFFFSGLGAEINCSVNATSDYEDTEIEPFGEQLNQMPPFWLIFKKVLFYLLGFLTVYGYSVFPVFIDFDYALHSISLIS